MITLKSFFYVSMIITGLFPFRNTFIKQPDRDDNFVKTELYFGMNKPDGSTVSESEFDAFSDSVICKVFSKGATILNSDGVWLGRTGLVKEDSRIVICFSKADEMNEEFSSQIDEVREKYKKYFKQEAVLRTDEYVEASF